MDRARNLALEIEVIACALASEEPEVSQQVAAQEIESRDWDTNFARARRLMNGLWNAFAAGDDQRGRDLAIEIHSILKTL